MFKVPRLNKSRACSYGFQYGPIPDPRTVSHLLSSLVEDPTAEGTFHLVGTREEETFSDNICRRKL